MTFARGLLLLAVTALSAGTACSFVLSRTEGQCNTHADCAARGGAFANSACTETHVCVPLPLADAAAEPAKSCTKNTDCAGASGLALCRPANGTDADGGGQCVKLNAKKCQSSNLGQTSDGALPIALLVPPAQAGGTLDDTVDLQRTATLAVGELDRAAQNPNLHALPPVVGVVCDETDPESLDYVLRDLGIRLVIGGPRDAVALSPILQKTRAAGAIFVSPLADDPALEATPNPNADGLFWSFRPNLARRMPFFGDLLKKTFELAHLPSDASVLLAGGTDATTSNFIDRVQATDAGVGVAAFKTKSRLDPLFVDYAPLVQQILSTTPRVVVAASTVERWGDIILDVEKAWPGSTPRPFYVMMDKDLAFEAKLPLLDVQCGGCDASSRVLGVYPHHDSTVYDAFVRAYTAANSTAPGYGPEFGYDALYESVYAITAASVASGGGSFVIDGASFKNAVASFNGPDGLARTTGSLGIAEFVTSLGQKVNLAGASGPLDFDPNRGSPAADAELYCFVKAKQKFCDTGVVFKSDTAGPPSGANACDCLH